MGIETIEKSELAPEADTEAALREYQKSPQFTEDLVKAFAAAVKQAQEENQSLGLTPGNVNQA